MVFESIHILDSNIENDLRIMINDTCLTSLAMQVAPIDPRLALIVISPSTL